MTRIPEFLPGLSWWMWKHSIFGNILYSIAFFVILLLFFKIYTTKDGKLRLHVLYILETLLFHCFVMIWCYNPMQNQWIQDFSKIPILAAFAYAAWYLIRNFGIPGHPHDTP